MKKIIIIMLLAITSSGVAAKPELKGNPEDLRQFLYPNDKIVSIYAEAEEKAYSDKAIISLVITTDDKKLSASLSKNSKLRESITKQLVDSGIDQDNIKSSKFSTSPQYGWFGKKPKSYKVVNRMAVSITDESQLQEIAAVADSNDEVELSDTAFEHTKKDELEDMVKEQALAKVMKQKEFYEKSLGIKLVPVGFRKANIGHRATRGAMILEEVVVTARKRSSSLQDIPMSISAFDSSAESSFDEVKYEAGIYVDFKIENGAK
tara:strand:- start:55 stop:843 length:789 start_codon:yes stop_codon:yes gene_type:complete